MVRSIPSNHSPAYLPVVTPTLTTGVEALVRAAHAWLAACEPARARVRDLRVVAGALDRADPEARIHDVTVERVVLALDQVDLSGEGAQLLAQRGPHAAACPARDQAADPAGHPAPARSATRGRQVAGRAPSSPSSIPASVCAEANRRKPAVSRAIRDARSGRRLEEGRRDQGQPGHPVGMGGREPDRQRGADRVPDRWRPSRPSVDGGEPLVPVALVARAQAEPREVQDAGRLGQRLGGRCPGVRVDREARQDERARVGVADRERADAGVRRERARRPDRRAPRRTDARRGGRPSGAVRSWCRLAAGRARPPVRRPRRSGSARRT